MISYHLFLGFEQGKKRKAFLLMAVEQNIDIE